VVVIVLLFFFLPRRRPLSPNGGRWLREVRSDWTVKGRKLVRTDEPEEEKRLSRCLKGSKVSAGWGPDVELIVIIFIYLKRD
uniref:Uncharacterized protein n=1 Tax=Caenorhabditis japonica TaxID=281687 RepID=A0A8R1ERP0_CAEJA